MLDNVYEIDDNDKRLEEIMENTIQNICKTCGQPILLGEPVKVTWNDEQDEHIVCPAPKIGQVSGEIQ